MEHGTILKLVKFRLADPNILWLIQKTLTAGVQEGGKWCATSKGSEQGKQYPYAFKSWESNWEVLSPFYKYPNEIRKIIYTTNIIEGVNRQFRKVTKTKSVFPSEASLEKILYLATKNVIKKWTQRYRN